MRNFSKIAALLPLLATAWAQPQAALEKTRVEKAVVMGKTVKGAPYSGDEVTESSQVLADGTHINHKSQVTVYRDGEGRVRRETPTQITIWDPVANVSYTLDPATKTGTKGPLGRVEFTFTSAGGPAGAVQSYVMVTSKDDNVTVNGNPVDPKSVPAALDKLTAEMKARAEEGAVRINSAPADVKDVTVAWKQLSVAKEKLDAVYAVSKAKFEPLGKQTIWGIEAEGTRTTSTLETGAIGNDRPISIVSERWYSPDLQTLMMTKHSDPRTGEETFRLINVRRGEPGADLFMVPPGYTLK